MSLLACLNQDHPPELVCRGTLGGTAIEADLENVERHVSSRYADVLKTTSKVVGVIALKVVYDHDVRAPHDVKKEVQLLAALAHPNICKLLNAYRVGSCNILVLPFYPFSLRRLLDAPTFVPSSFAFEPVAKSLICQMCSALAYLREQKVAHRDVSPSNWALNPDGELVLLDFGTAWSASDPGSEGIANLHFELGTGPYRAPELLFGSKAYDPFALDIWSLGATIAEFFTFIGPEPPSSPSSDTSDPPVVLPPWQVPAQVVPVKRFSLFEGGMSDFTLIGSMFKILGTPTIETWPEAAELPDFGKFNYKIFPKQDINSILPNLPTSRKDSDGFGSGRGPGDIVASMLQYPFKSRMSAKAALQHPWLSDAIPVVTSSISDDTGTRSKLADYLQSFLVNPAS